VGRWGIGAEDNRNAAGVHQAEHRGTGLISRMALFAPLVLSSMATPVAAMRSSARSMKRLDAREIPVGGRFVFDQVGMRERIVESGFRRAGEMVE